MGEKHSFSALPADLLYGGPSGRARGSATTWTQGTPSATLASSRASTGDCEVSKREASSTRQPAVSAESAFTRALERARWCCWRS